MSEALRSRQIENYSGTSDKGHPETEKRTMYYIPLYKRWSFAPGYLFSTASKLRITSLQSPDSEFILLPKCLLFRGSTVKPSAHHCIFKVYQLHAAVITFTSFNSEEMVDISCRVFSTLIELLLSTLLTVSPLSCSETHAHNYIVIHNIATLYTVRTPNLL